MKLNIKYAPLWITTLSCVLATISNIVILCK